MTRITMEWGRTLRLRAEGHAGGGEYGEDIICAGESAIIQTLGQYLIDGMNAGKVKADIRINREQARTELTARPRIGHRGEVKDWFRMSMTGLKMIRERYPENIEIKEVRR